MNRDHNSGIANFTRIDSESCTTSLVARVAQQVRLVHRCGGAGSVRYARVCDDIILAPTLESAAVNNYQPEAGWSKVAAHTSR